MQEKKNSKACTKCGTTKSFVEFPKNSSSPDGFYSRCKPCTKEAKAKYRERPDVKAKEADRLRADYLSNRAVRLEQRKARYVANKEATLEKNRAWRQENIEYHRAQCRKWAKDHPVEMRAIVAKRRSLMRGAEGAYTKKDVDAIFAKQGGCCLACGGDFIDLGYHVDHIHPLSKGGSNWPENLQLLCPTCNRKKSDKTEWIPRES